MSGSPLKGKESNPEGVLTSKPIRQNVDEAWTSVFCIRPSPDEDGVDRAHLRKVIAQAKDGDGGAIHHLYDRYADNVFSYVRTIVCDHHEAEDVTQHVFTNLLTRINRYEERSVPFTAWLLRIARNCAIDHLRTRRAIYCEDVPVVERPAHDEGAFDRRDAIEGALKALPDGQRRVILLRHVMGLSPREIAAQMGKSEGAIHTLHHRARRALRTELSQRGTVPLAGPGSPFASARAHASSQRGKRHRGRVHPAAAASGSVNDRADMAALQFN